MLNMLPPAGGTEPGTPPNDPGALLAPMGFTGLPKEGTEGWALAPAGADPKAGGWLPKFMTGLPKEEPKSKPLLGAGAGALDPLLPNWNTPDGAGAAPGAEAVEG